MNLPDVTWALGRPTIGGAAALASRLRVYGRDRVPLDGGLVVASNHFSWLDPAVLGAASPRVLYYMAKVEAHRVPGSARSSGRSAASPCAVASRTGRRCARCGGSSTRATRSACSWRERGSGPACPARCSRAPRWSPSRRACRSSRSRSTGRRSGSRETSSRCRSPGRADHPRRAAQGRTRLQGGVRAAPGGDPAAVRLARRRPPAGSPGRHAALRTRPDAESPRRAGEASGRARARLRSSASRTSASRPSSTA